MTTKRTLAALLALLGCMYSPAAEAAPEEKHFTFAYIRREHDPAYIERRVYTGLKLRERKPLLAAVELALRDSRIFERRLGVTFRHVERILKKNETIVAAINALASLEQAQAFLLDLPADDISTAAKALATRQDIILFNARHGDNALRGRHCSPVLFHTYPSDAMLTDGLAQYLFKMKWTRVLVLHGGSRTDLSLKNAFLGSARKFGLKVTNVIKFVLSNDPRIRADSNIALLTGSDRYDVIFLADGDGEYGRYVPYRTYLPRPVVGTEGLRPGAWHWTWERHGAPQLNQRFQRRNKRNMTGRDWATWVATKSVVEGIVRTNSVDMKKIHRFLVSDSFILDGYKGTPSNFRHWNNQLRQPILLHVHNAVVARAPIDGFHHKSNTLDTLGQDRPESKCNFR